MKANKEELKRNWMLRNVVLAVAFVAGIVILASVFLAVYTRHNKEIRVPDLSNLSYREAVSVAAMEGLQVEIQDSVYVRRLKSGVVFKQSPQAGKMVKKGRTIQVTTNTKVPKKIPMPSLVGFSTRQAKAEIVRNGLVLGRLIYVRDIATNVVLRQQIRGMEISPGTMIISGSTVDLVAGSSSMDNMTFVPDLTGRQYLRAVDILQENSLNVGRLRFDSSVKNYADSLNAVVKSQNPPAGQESVLMGTEVSLILALEEE